MDSDNEGNGQSSKRQRFDHESSGPSKNVAQKHNLYKLKKNCDVKLQSTIDQKIIAAHRDVLQSSNEYFKKLFTSPLTAAVVNDKEGHQIFTIGIAGNVLEALVGYCYSEEIKINDDNVDQILEAASMLQFDPVREMCVQHLEENLAISNCLGVWLLAKHYDIKKILEKALEIALWNFRKVVKEKEFLHMNLEPLVTFLGHDHINVHSEEKIFDAAMAWIEFDEPNRKCAFPELIKTIRLNHLKVSFLEDRAVSCAERLGFLSEYRIALDKNRDVEHRPQMECPELYLFQTGGMERRDYVQIDQYSYQKGEWLAVHRIDRNRHNFGVVLVNDRYLYIIDGEDRTMHRVDIDSWEMVELNGMRYGKSDIQAVHLDNKVYVYGEGDGGEIHFERYDIDSDEWSDLRQDLTAPTGDRPETFRHSDSLCVYGGAIYKISVKFSVSLGGRRRYHSDAARYNPATDTWRSAGESLMQVEAIFIYKDELFLIGNDPKPSNALYPKKIERYNVDAQTFSLLDVNTIGIPYWIQGAFTYKKDVYVQGRDSLLPRDWNPVQGIINMDSLEWREWPATKCNYAIDYGVHRFFRLPYEILMHTFL